MKKIYLRIIPVFLKILVISFVLSIIYFIYSSNKLISSSGNNSKYFFNIISKIYKHNPLDEAQKYNILVLGLDRRDDRLEKTEVTDTIMLASFDLQTSKVKLISLPRDLWSVDQKMKINGLYQLAKNENKNLEFLSQEYEKIYGQKIDKVVIISTSNLIDLVKTIGGVEVTLDKGFRDEKYPNPDYIFKPNPDTPIYKTIEFSQGNNILNESNITEFVRSRKSSETSADGGTDIGRIKRQQLLIEALISKLKSKDFINNPKNLVSLYVFWHKNIETNVIDEDIFSIIFKLKSKILNVSIEKVNVPIVDVDENGVIYHPETTTFTKQWIFMPLNDDYKQIHEFISKSLN